MPSEGSVDSIAYKNEVNGFAVLTLDANGEPITVVGEIGDVEEGRAPSNCTAITEYAHS